MVMKPLLALLLLVGVARAEPEPAHAVALLPLDADAKLELYGQPVASELARALVQGGLDVVVVGPKMAVPEKARLVVDGTIKAGKGDTVTLSARIRDSRDGTVYDTLAVTAGSLTAIDQAEEQLSGKVLPAVKDRLASLIAADRARVPELPKPAKPAPSAPSAPSSPSSPSSTLLVSVSSAGGAGAALGAALSTALVPWATHRHHRVVVSADKAMSATTVAAQKADLAITLEVLSIAIGEAEAAPIPTARARVHVRILDPQGVVFDRVIKTDTIVGDKGLDQPALVARTAREILSIADPQVRRRVPSWF